MADHLTEEEQLEALKRWWNEYWKSVVIPIVLVAGGYYGWSEYQAGKEAKAQAGGFKYEQLIQVMETEPGQSLSADNQATAKALAAAMIEEYSATLYADQAALILARFAVSEGDLDAAAKHLQSVVDSGSNTAIQLLAKTRLARVKVSQGEYDAALAMASGTGDSEYNAVFAEIRGDALAAQGNADAAATAYQEAIDTLSASQFSRRSILQMKVDGAAILASKAVAGLSDAATGKTENVTIESEEAATESQGETETDSSDSAPEASAESDAGAENS